jgi:hypothetical protein
MREIKTYDVILTPFSDVRLSEKTLLALSSIDKNWRDTYHNKRARSKKAKEVKRFIFEIERAATAMSELYWLAGQEFTEI